MTPGIQLQQSAIDELIDAEVHHPEGQLTHEPHLHSLALQVQYNLQYQHDWTAVQIHTHSPLNKSTKLPRPLVSGVPPRPVYIHPDTQIEMIKAGIEEKDAPLRREWVLPTHLRERWTLKRFGDVFDAIGKMPPNQEIDEPESSQEFIDLKRVLLATANDDSTVLYYIVHDGVVKPRQN